MVVTASVGISYILLSTLSLGLVIPMVLKLRMHVTRALNLFGRSSGNLVRSNESPITGILGKGKES